MECGNPTCSHNNGLHILPSLSFDNHPPGTKLNVKYFGTELGSKRREKPGKLQMPLGSLAKKNRFFHRAASKNLIGGWANSVCKMLSAIRSILIDRNAKCKIQTLQNLQSPASLDLNFDPARIRGAVIELSLIHI